MFRDSYQSLLSGWFLVARLILLEENQGSLGLSAKSRGAQ